MEHLREAMKGVRFFYTFLYLLKQGEITLIKVLKGLNHAFNPNELDGFFYKVKKQKNINF
jgi:hypothetical protein